MDIKFQQNTLRDLEYESDLSSPGLISQICFQTFQNMTLVNKLERHQCFYIQLNVYFWNSNNKFLCLMLFNVAWHRRCHLSSSALELIISSSLLLVTWCKHEWTSESILKETVHLTERLISHVIALNQCFNCRKTSTAVHLPQETIQCS